MIPIGTSLPLLTDHEAEHAARVAALDDDALGSCRTPAIVGEVCAIQLVNVIAGHGVSLALGDWVKLDQPCAIRCACGRSRAGPRVSWRATMVG